YRYAVYLENHGETDAATAAYERAIAVTRDIPLLPEWEQSPLRRALTPDEAAYSPLAQTILLLQRGDVAAAQALWSSYPARASDVSGYHVLSSWLALVEGNRALAAAKLDDAQRLAYNRNARAWVELGAAMLNEAEFDQHV